VDFLNTKRCYLSYIRAKKKKFFSSVGDRLSNSRDSKYFYSALSLYKPKYNSDSSKEFVKPETFKEFYTHLFSKSVDNECIENMNTTITELDKEFAFSELNYAIRNLPKDKSAGRDIITNEIWINLFSSHRLMLLDCINACWRDNKIPACWLEIVIAPIYKKVLIQIPLTIDQYH
jgi:hypothetical protein